MALETELTKVNILGKPQTRALNECETPAHYMRYWREKAGMSREALALEAGVCQETIERWETDKYGPTVALAGLVADVLGISIDVYVGRDITGISEEE